MAGRLSEAEYEAVLEETRALVERLCRKAGGSVPPALVRQHAGWPQSSTSERLSSAAKRGLLRYHDGGTYSPAVDAEGRPLRLALVAGEGELQAD